MMAWMPVKATSLAQLPPLLRAIVRLCLAPAVRHRDHLLGESLMSTTHQSSPWSSQAIRRSGLGTESWTSADPAIPAALRRLADPDGRCAWPRRRTGPRGSGGVSLRRARRMTLRGSASCVRVGWLARGPGPRAAQATHHAPRGQGLWPLIRDAVSTSRRGAHMAASTRTSRRVGGSVALDRRASDGPEGGAERATNRVAGRSHPTRSRVHDHAREWLSCSHSQLWANTAVVNRGRLGRRDSRTR